MRAFVCGFGLELGGIISLCLWPEIEHTAIPITFIGAALMVGALIFRK